MYSPSYLPAGEPVENAVVRRLNQKAIEALAGGVAEELVRPTAKRLSRGVFVRERIPESGRCEASAQVTVQSVAFDPLQVVLDPGPGGFNVTVDIPNLEVTATASDYCGIPYAASGGIGATNVRVETTLLVSLDEGGYVVKIPEEAVHLQGFHFGIPGIPSSLESLVRQSAQQEVENRIGGALRAALPKEVRQALEGLSQPISRTFNGRTVTFTPKPTSVDFDVDGFTTTFDGQVEATKDPATPTVPGAGVRLGDGLPLQYLRPLCLAA